MDDMISTINSEVVAKPFGANSFIEKKGSDYGRYWYKDIREIMTLKELLDGSIENYSERPSFWVKEKRGGEYIPVSYEVLGRDVEAMGTMMLELKIGRAHV